MDIHASPGNSSPHVEVKGSDAAVRAAVDALLESAANDHAAKVMLGRLQVEVDRRRTALLIRTIAITCRNVDDRARFLLVRDLYDYGFAGPVSLLDEDGAALTAADNIPEITGPCVLLATEDGQPDPEWAEHAQSAGPRTWRLDLQSVLET